MRVLFNHDPCHPSQQRIAELSSLSRSQVIRVLARLTKKGLITRYKTFGVNNQYFLQREAILKLQVYPKTKGDTSSMDDTTTSSTHDTRPVSFRGGDQCHLDTQPVAPMLHKYILNNRNRDLNRKTEPKKLSSTPLLKQEPKPAPREQDWMSQDLVEKIREQRLKLGALDE